MFLLKLNHRKIQVPETAYWFRIKTWIETFSRLSSTRKNGFNLHAVGMNSWVQTTSKLILWETLFSDQLHIFSLLSSNSFLYQFLKSKFLKKFLGAKIWTYNSRSFLIIIYHAVFATTPTLWLIMALSSTQIQGVPAFSSITKTVWCNKSQSLS